MPLPQTETILNHLAALMIEHFPQQFDHQLYKQIQREQQNPDSHIRRLAEAVAMSDFVADVLHKQPHFLRQCWQTPPSFSACENYMSRLSEQLREADQEQDFYRILRLFRNREMALLSICQSLNLATVEQIFIRLSQLAEALIIQARDWLYQRACAEMGTPTDEEGRPQQLYILGMGKLGGYELNFSSDIDLIFTYPSGGETRGARKAIDNQKFFIRLGQRLINALDQYSADGFVYRTDMRLRPFGDSGALALSFNAMESYYQEQGRDWERYAMIKGRILGAEEGDPNVLSLRRLLRPFVYRRYIDFSVIQSLRDMKNKIAREVRRRNLSNNIKLGAGGIREIEFIVQVFQLMRGGRELSLQQYSLLALLPEIEKLGLLTSQQCEDLQQAYLFLRRTENILQAIEDKQIQVLPENERDQARLIHACAVFSRLNPQQCPVEIRYPIQDWQSFLQILQGHQQKVRDIFNSLIGEENPSEQESEESEWNDFLDTDRLDDDQENAPWPAAMAGDAQLRTQIWEILSRFKQELARRPIGHRGREVLSALVPLLLQRIFSRPDPLPLLPRMLNIVEKVLTRTTYLELLLEHPAVLSRLIELCSQSKMIAEQLARHPILLDELLDQDSLYHPIPCEQYASELRQYLLRLPQEDEEQFFDGLRQFKQVNLLRIAAADILNVLPVMKVSDHLTFLAEAIIAAVVEAAWQKVSARFGTPAHLAPEQKGFAVIGYGKLGGIELGYKSDLDMVFLYDGAQSQTQGGIKTIDSSQFYLRLAQKIVSIFSTNTSAGILYDVDMRLRPSGEAGLLVSSLNAFEDYQRHEAWTWEHQALVRARSVFGESRLQQRFAQIRSDVLAMPRDTDKLRSEVRQMREKMYLHLANTAADKFNIKTDPGGITDIEFIAQYLVLANAPHNQDLAYWSDNVRIFDVMASNRVIELEEAERLKSCYVTLRNRIHHLNLLGEDTLVSAQEFHQERQFIRQIWQRLFVGDTSPS
ncbi:glutamate-ammonia-ligase adenylyltransferase [Mesocricetibacter intestinalis]|uniref:Bifunctional glutamine synthetase adenylyltransferase/adenylyl-removing enzyme n=1 Tax=Mesocricetibacter intestinalis TaxID=1521930 RepID=A0A4R6VGB2_9PAST|nr:bifunctional [glutamate--ammonia ligase]-adenylyl-L-tyrosine phosphorylase/[glutamate--ammonia-ligase] adenylyltransferase [Mesocricetibacter intestinalis]TDQ59851.1 glutamate-ammonia-ligase adenylyltransferase [Mesocricetibacter intestinalis]